MSNIIRDKYNVCPTCWSTMITNRSFKKPKYRCEVCNEEFSNKKIITKEQRDSLNNTIKRLRKLGVVTTAEDIRFESVKAIKEKCLHA